MGRRVRLGREESGSAREQAWLVSAYIFFLLWLNTHKICHSDNFKMYKFSSIKYIQCCAAITTIRL